MKDDRKEKNLKITINTDLHTEVKTRAAYRHMSMKRWLLTAIMDLIKKESQYE